MRAILASLIHIAQRTGRFTVAEATAFYNGSWMAIGFVLLTCFAAFELNAEFDKKIPSLIFAIIFVIEALYLWAKPLHILVVGGFGFAKKVVTDSTVADEVEKAIKIYLDLLKWVLLMGVTFLFVMGTIPFHKSPGAILPLLVALGVIGLFSWVWPNVFVGAWGRRLVYAFAVVIVAKSLWSLVPEDSKPDWIKGDEKPRPVACLPFSATEVHRCVLTEKPIILTAEKLSYPEVLEFCIVRPVEALYESKTIGPNTFQIRSTSGALPIQYKLVKGSCPDKF